MKKLEFETSKGRFLVSESDEHYDYRFIGLLSRITEEQASEIVDYDGGYIDYCAIHKGWFSSPIESLHSLLKSKGIHLFENHYADKIGITDFDYHRNKAEQKTFYNPYIFKL